MSWGWDATDRRAVLPAPPVEHAPYVATDGAWKRAECPCRWAGVWVGGLHAWAMAQAQVAEHSAETGVL